MSTYDISSSSRFYLYNHAEYDEMEANFATSDYLFGAGKVESINTTGRDNNPFDPDPDDKYLTIFEGYIYIPEAGTYSFAVNGDDAVEVIIDDLYYGWYGGHGADGTDHNFQIDFEKKGYYKLKFRHQEWQGADSYQFYWKQPGSDRYEIVPYENLFYCAPPQPVVEYRFDACEWGDVKDSSGNGVDAKVKGDVHPVAAKEVGGGLCRVGVFDGSGDYIIAQKSDLPLDYSQFTVSLWFYINEYPNNSTKQYALISKDLSFELYVYKQGGIWWWWKNSDGTNAQIKTDEGVIKTNRWYHIAIVFQKGKQELYLDGKLLASANSTKAVKVIDHALTVGVDLASSNGNPRDNSMNGSIDEVKIYAKALSGDQIERLYKNESVGRNADGSVRHCILCPSNPSCNLKPGLYLSTYDISGYSKHWPGSHKEFDQLETDFATDDRLFGIGTAAQINTTGSNNNPFGAQEYYLTIFEGYIYIPEAGEYRFAVNGDDAVEVIFEDEAYYGWYGPHGSDGTEHNERFIFGKAGYYKLKFRHQEWKVADSYQLYWKQPGSDRYEIVPASNLFRCTPPDPVAEYRMDSCAWSGVENEVKDSSTNALHGQTFGGTQPDIGKLCQAAKFDGVNDYIQVKNSDKLDGTKKLSLSFWIYPEEVRQTNGTNARGVLSKRIDTTNENAYGVFFWNDQEMTEDGAKLYIDIDGVNDRFHTTNYIYKNRWSHVVIVFDGDKPQSERVRVYIDGKLDTIAAERSSQIPHYNSDFFIGDLHYRNSKKVFKGKIDEVKVFREALSEEDVKRIYRFEKSGSRYDGERRYCPLCAIKPECKLQEGVKATFYKKDGSHPYSHEEYEIMEQKFATDTNKYGSKILPQINTSGSDNNPFTKNPDGNYLTIIEGFIYIPQAGEYRFAVNGDDAVEVIFNSIDYYGWYGGHGADTTVHNRVFKFGERGYYRLKFRHEEGYGADNFQLYWMPPGSDRYEIVPKRFLFTCSTYRSYLFDAWDSYRSIDDRNISTKIVAKEFNLTVASLSEEGDEFSEFNGTVCLQPVDDHNSSLSAWKKVLFQEQNRTEAAFRIDRAARTVRMLIRWKENEDSECNATDLNATLSSDDFAVRPDKFSMELPALAYAGEVFEANLSANDFTTAPSKEYNETLGTTFVVEANETKKGCKRADPDIETFSFSNGKAENISFVYPEIGDINFTVKESSEEFAKVDRDDTPLAQRLITEASKVIRVIPYEINVTDVRWSVSTGSDWLYMAQNIADMNITIGYEASVYSKTGALMDDFNSTCYGYDVDLQFFYDYEKGNSDDEHNLTLWGDLLSFDRGLSDINKTVRIEVEHFSGGKGNGNYAFGVDRNFTHPLSPLFVQLKDLTIQTGSYSKGVHGARETGLIQADQNATFYYGRLKTNDLTTSKTTDSVFADILVYNVSSRFTGDQNQTILHWYLWSKHNEAKFGKVKRALAYKDTLMNHSADVGVSYGDPRNGRVQFSFTKQNDTSAFIHLDISPWLWFSYNEDGSYNPASDCTHHPCIKYDFFVSNPDQVQSGSISGVRFDQNVSKQRRGVKVFR